MVPSYDVHCSKIGVLLAAYGFWQLIHGYVSLIIGWYVYGCYHDNGKLARYINGSAFGSSRFGVQWLLPSLHFCTSCCCSCTLRAELAVFCCGTASSLPESSFLSWRWGMRPGLDGCSQVSDYKHATVTEALVSICNINFLILFCCGSGIRNEAIVASGSADSLLLPIWLAGPSTETLESSLQQL